MGVDMAGIQHRSFDQPNESRTPDKTRIDVVELGDVEVGRFTFEPGWRWSECIRPVAGTDSCQNDHVGYLASGRPVIAQDTGFGSVLPTGEGLFAFRTADDIQAAIDLLDRDYETHRKSARRIAEEHFDSDVVLPDLLSRLGLAA